MTFDVSQIDGVSLLIRDCRPSAEDISSSPIEQLTYREIKLSTLL